MQRFTIILILTFYGFALSGAAQVRLVKLGIDGLTCSQCSYNVEYALLKLNVIKKIDMDLNLHDAKIYFKEKERIPFHQLTQKVIDAGYSVRFLRFIFDSDTLTENQNSFYLLSRDNIKPLEASGEFELVDRRINKRKYNLWSKAIETFKKANPTLEPLYFVVPSDSIQP